MAVRILLGGRRPEVGRRSRLPGSGIIDVVNNQFIPSIVELNWGEATELPFLEVEFVRPEKDRAIAERDKLLFQEMGLPVSTQWLYDRLNLPL